MFLASCGDGQTDEAATKSLNAGTIVQGSCPSGVACAGVQDPLTASVTVAPADRATLSGIVRLEISGSDMVNAELLPATSYLPRRGVFNVSADHTRATLDFDTTTLPNGPVQLRISAFNVPAGQPGASEVIAMPARTWNINNANPPATGFSAALASAPPDGTVLRGIVHLEVRGSGLGNVELLPASGYTPRLAVFNVSADRTVASLDVDSRSIPDGMRDVRISAFDLTQGQPNAREIVVMPARRWNFSNGVGFAAAVTLAPANTALVAGITRLEVRGSGMRNVELLPASGYLPRFGVFNVAADGTYAWLDFDTAALPEGTLDARISAFNTPAGQPGATEIIAMPARQWNLRRAQPNTWQIVELGGLGGTVTTPSALNDNGEVVGNSAVDANNSVYHAFRYRMGQMQDLGTLGGRWSNATAINNAGQIVGVANTAGDIGHAFLYNNGAMTDLGQRINGSVFSWAADINDVGDVALSIGASPFVYHPNGSWAELSSLGNVFGLKLNNPGALMLNRGTDPNHSTAFLLYSGGSLIELRLPIPAPPLFPGSVAYDLNNQGDVVGTSNNHAFLYRGGMMNDINASIGTVTTINDKGQMTGGSPPFLYSDGQRTDLNALSEVTAAGWTLSSITAINNKGQMVGVGSRSGRQAAFLLTPPAQ